MDTKDFPKSASLLLMGLQMLGRLLVLIFLFSVAFSMLTCPPWSCHGESVIIYMFPFMAFFTILPIGIILIFSTRKSKFEKDYGSGSMKRFSSFLFVAGLFLVLAFLYQLGFIVLKCSSWECVSMLSKRFVLPFLNLIPFLNLYTVLPLSGLLIFSSKKLNNLEFITEDQPNKKKNEFHVEKDELW